MCYNHLVPAQMILVCSRQHICHSNIMSKYLRLYSVYLKSRLHGVFPFQRSISKMCCIIFMIGCDAHINANQTLYESFNNIDIICEQFYIHHAFMREQTSEPMNPGPLLNIRSTTFYCSFTVFTVLYFLATINKNTKTLLLSASIKQKPKKNFTFLCLLFCYFIYCFILSLIILIRSLVLDNHTVELGAQDKRLVLQVARRG